MSFLKKICGRCNGKGGWFKKTASGIRGWKVCPDCEGEGEVEEEEVG